MENASKALIIAGAILLSILIIGLGMLIFNNARDVIEGAGNMDPQKLAAYNSTFTDYDGVQSGTSVRTLIGNVISHNSSGDALDDSSLQIGITFSGTGNASSVKGQTKEDKNIDDVIDNSALQTVRSKVSSGKRYDVLCNLSSQGRVINITITERGASSGGTTTPPATNP